MSSGMKSSRAANGSNKQNATKKSAESAETKISKSQPTADQIRIAQLTDNVTNGPEGQQQELIEKFMQFTGQDKENAIVSLHDHDNNVDEAIDAYLNGESASSGWLDGTKKKKPKAKPELEANKDNRRGGNDNRDRSGSRPRGGSARGRGRGRGEGASASRGASTGRRGGRFVANGGGPGAGFRGGRGGRSFRGGRGGGAPHPSDIPQYNDGFSNQTYGQSAQSDETWGGNVADSPNNWGPSAVEEDWNNIPTKEFQEQAVIEECDEWDGSLKTTNVFVASQKQQQQLSEQPSPPPASDLTPIDAAKLNNSSVYSSKLNDSVNMPPSFAAAASTGSPIAAPHAANQANGNQSGSVVMPMSPVQQKQSFSAPPTVNTAAIDLERLLQQAAPQSSMTSGDKPTASQPLPQMSNNNAHMLLSSLKSVVEPVKLPAMQIPTNYNTQHYTAPPNTPMYPPPGLPLNNNTTHALQVTKARVTVPDNVVEMPSQARPSTRPPKATTKIPLSAVEMPEDHMSTVAVQLSGLKFGNDEFDFMADTIPSLADHVVEPVQLVHEPEVSVSPENPATGTAGLSHAPNYSAAAALHPTYHQSGQLQAPASTANDHYNPPQHPSQTAQPPQQQPMPSYQQYSNHGGYGTSLSGYPSSVAPQQSYSAPQDARMMQHKPPTHQPKPAQKYQSEMPTASPYMSQQNSYSSQQYQYNGDATNAAITTTSPTTSTMQHTLSSATTAPQQTKTMSSVGASETMSQSQHQAAHVHQVPQMVMPGQQNVGQFVGSNQIQNPMLYPAMQPQMYSNYDHMEMMNHMLRNQAQPPSNLTAGRDAASLGGGGYNNADIAKFRQDQNSSPVPSAIQTQQGAHGQAYLNSTGPVHPLYMYQNLMPNNYAQYQHPALIQLPANTAAGNSQYQAPKLQYNTAQAYYEPQNASEYKATYGSGAVSSQSKQPSNTGMSSNVTDMPNYKSHVNKTYEKTGNFHTSTPPPFNMAGNAPQYQHTGAMYLPTCPPTHNHSTLLHHQMHQQEGAGAPRGPVSGAANKVGAKQTYTGPAFWGSS